MPSMSLLNMDTCVCDRCTGLLPGAFLSRDLQIATSWRNPPLFALPLSNRLSTLPYLSHLLSCYFHSQQQHNYEILTCSSTHTHTLSSFVTKTSHTHTSLKYNWKTGLRVSEKVLFKRPVITWEKYMQESCFHSCNWISAMHMEFIATSWKMCMQTAIIQKSLKWDLCIQVHYNQWQT